MFAPCGVQKKKMIKKFNVFYELTGKSLTFDWVKRDAIFTKYINIIMVNINMYDKHSYSKTAYKNTRLKNVTLAREN